MNLNSIVIRRARSDDHAILVKFQQEMAQETEGKTLDANVLVKGINAVFKCPSKGFYIVAEISGKIVGSLLITYEWSDWRNSNIWWIQSVYVKPDHRQRGVYRALNQEVLNLAKDHGSICGIRLYVDKTNDVAQWVYRNLGMSESNYDMYEIEFGQ